MDEEASPSSVARSLATISILLGVFGFGITALLGLRYVNSGIIVKWPQEPMDLIHIFLFISVLGLAAAAMSAWLARGGVRPTGRIAAGALLNLLSWAVLLLLKWQIA